MKYYVYLFIFAFAIPLLLLSQNKESIKTKQLPPSTTLAKTLKYYQNNQKEFTTVLKKLATDKKYAKSFDNAVSKEDEIALKKLLVNGGIKTGDISTTFRSGKVVITICYTTDSGWTFCFTATKNT
jgi:hypothetical protein